MSKPVKTQTAAAKHNLRYLAGTTDFSITTKKGDFKISIVPFADANWGNNPTNGRPMSSYIVMLSKAPVSFKMGLQGITTQSTMDEELVAAALAMKAVLLRRDDRARIQKEGQPCANLHRQHCDATLRPQPHLQRTDQALDPALFFSFGDYARRRRR